LQKLFSSSQNLKLTFFQGTRLYREPASKSNRSIILNAIEYVVFPGVVNAETRNRVLVSNIERCKILQRHE
jgi:calmodulin-regulated spectrin-associated protein